MARISMIMAGVDRSIKSDDDSDEVTDLKFRIKLIEFRIKLSDFKNFD